MPELLVFTTLSPIMFVLLFAYVFGGAIKIPGAVNYREFLIAGHLRPDRGLRRDFTGVGMAEDMQKGIIDRFRIAADGAVGGAGRSHRQRHRRSTSSA